MPRWPSTTLVACAALAAATAVVASSGGGIARPAPTHLSTSAWRAFVEDSRPDVALGQRVIVLLRAPSLADRVRAAGGRASDSDERRWAAVALASQQQFMAELARRGIVARPDVRFTRVLNGFSAIVDPKVVTLLERAPEVEGVYPVRAAFPASPGPADLARESPAPAGLSEFTGRGVTVALLDTGVDRFVPFLHGRVEPGVDLVAKGPDARAVRPPEGPGAVESHGTETAGIVVGLGGPGRPSGLAPDATLLPIRVAGWQPDAAGRWSIHGRTDQILAGLELAVDPDRDGDAHDAARIALVPLVEPYAAFADGPLARAVQGATDLDMLVVAPAGNDGPAGPVFGSVGGPAGAPAALGVGATDLRPVSVEVPVAAGRGLRVVARRDLALLGGPDPTGSATLDLVAMPQRPFDAAGRSRVAGRAVVVPVRAHARATAASAAKSGAALVLLAGDELPAGALGVDDSLPVPVLAAPRSLLRAARSGAARWIAVGPVDEKGPDPLPASPAPFSSRGLAFGGEPKPDVLAPGVGVGTAQPGSDGAGGSRFLAVNGSSAAAAVVAGAAARLAQARPDLDARGLRGVLIGTAGRSASGAGLVEVGRAATAEIVAEPPSLSFGRVTRDGGVTRVLTVRNVSTRPLTVYVSVPKALRSAGLRVRPARVRVKAGSAASLHARLRPAGREAGAAVSGAVHLTPARSVAIAVPVGAALSPVPAALLADVRLSARAFRPSDDAPDVLSVRAGLVQLHDGVPLLEPVLRLDVQLWSEDGRMLGLLARLRDALPGRYAFGLTGRSPDGKVLSPGRYRLRLVAWPAAGGPPVRRAVWFGIE